MKFIGRLFAGIGIGLGAGIVLWLLIFSWPLFACTGDLLCGTLSCDYNRCEKALCSDAYECDDCDAETVSQPKYLYTFIFSVIVCSAIGGIWGIVDQSTENSKNRENAIWSISLKCGIVPPPYAQRFRNKFWVLEQKRLLCSSY